MTAIIIVLTIVVLLFFKTVDEVADWGSERRRRDANVGRRFRNFVVMLIAIAVIIMFASAGSGN